MILQREEENVLETETEQKEETSDCETKLTRCLRELASLNLLIMHFFS